MNLLTSHSKPFANILLTPFPYACEISRGKVNNFLSIYPHHLHLDVRVVLDFVLFSRLVPSIMPDGVRIPRARNLPPTSFRLHLTVSTLVLS